MIYLTKSAIVGLTIKLTKYNCRSMPQHNIMTGLLW